MLGGVKEKCRVNRDAAVGLDLKKGPAPLHSDLEVGRRAGEVDQALNASN